MKYFVVYLWNFVFLWIFIIIPLWRIGRFYFRDPKKWSKLELDIKYEGILKLYLFGFVLLIFAICSLAFIWWWYSSPISGVLLLPAFYVYFILIVVAEVKIFNLRRSIKRMSQLA